MPETHINALYADLVTAKQEVAVAQGKVELLEDQIRGRGGEVPVEEVEASKAPAEDTANQDDVSAAEVKPLDKMNRTELNAVATEKGVEAPEELGTKKDVLDAIQATDNEAEA